MEIEDLERKLKNIVQKGLNVDSEYRRNKAAYEHSLRKLENLRNEQTALLRQFMKFADEATSDIEDLEYAIEHQE